MFKNIYWSATSELEVKDIKNKVKTYNNIFIAEDLPRVVDETPIVKEKESGKLKVVWISRIAPYKNLMGAIEILKNVKGDIEFTIYGPKHVPCLLYTSGIRYVNCINYGWWKRDKVLASFY